MGIPQGQSKLKLFIYFFLPPTDRSPHFFVVILRPFKLSISAVNRSLPRKKTGSGVIRFYKNHLHHKIIGLNLRWKSGKRSLAKWWFLVRGRRQGNSPIRSALAAREGGKNCIPNSRQAMCGSLNVAGVCCVVEVDAGRTRAQMIRRVANRFLWHGVPKSIMRRAVARLNWKLISVV